MPTQSSVQTAAGLLNPSMAMGLNGLTDWSPQHPFIDHFHLVRPWSASTVDADGTLLRYDYEDLQDNGWIDANGWPSDLPADISLTGYLAWGSDAAFEYRSGTYRIEWTGQGDLTLRNATVVDSGEGWLEVEVDRPGNLWFQVRGVDADNPVRDITMVREDQVALFEAGAIFNPDWINLIDDLRQVRFMDWQNTNNSTQSAWADRPQMEDAFWDEAPLEVMVALGNQIGSDIWVNMPHLATEEYIREFATYVRDTLDPELRVYVEFSNEVWNFGFGQARDSHVRGQAEVGTGSAWVQRYGMDTAHTMQIWSEVFGGDGADRLVRVLATQTTVTARTIAALDAPDYAALDPDFIPPSEYVDAIAVATYFNGISDLRSDVVDDLMGWIEASIDMSNGPEDRYDHFITLAVAEITQGAMNNGENALDFVARNLAAQRAIADAYGLDLISYEGGQHVNPQGPDARDPLMIEFMNALATSDEMGQIYDTLFDIWYAADPDGPFMQFVDVGSHGAFGAWGALESLDGESARWDATVEENETREVTWETRSPTTFDHGITVYGDATADALEGTVEEDFLLGRGGDDTITGGAGNDGLHGGDGDDQLVGGAGDDTLFGGQGRDIFAVGEGRDQINDFVVGEDILDLTASGLTLAAFQAGEIDITNIALDAVLDLGNGNQVVVTAGAGRDWLPADFTFGDASVAAAPNVINGVQADIIMLSVTDGHLFAQATQGLHISAINMWTDTGRDLDGMAGTDADDAFAVHLHDGSVDYDDIHGGVGVGTTAGVSYGLGIASIQGTELADYIRGRAQEIEIDAGGGNDLVWGGSGDDILTGGAGSDRIWGGQGDDTFVIRAANGAIVVEDFEAGSDRIDVTGTRFGLADLVLAQGSATTGKNTLLIEGTTVTLRNVAVRNLDAADFEFGQPSSALVLSEPVDMRIDALNIWAAAARDLGVHASQTEDIYVGGAYAVTARDAAVSYDQINTGGLAAGEAAGASYHIDITQIITGDGDDFFRGRAKAADLDLGAGRDFAMGGWGDDTLNGGADNDTLFGGGGADTFVLDALSGHDRIGDFELGVDRFDVSALGLTDGMYPQTETRDDGLLLTFADDMSVLLSGVGDWSGWSDFGL